MTFFSFLVTKPATLADGKSERRFLRFGILGGVAPGSREMQDFQTLLVQHAGNMTEALIRVLAGAGPRATLCCR